MADCQADDAVLYSNGVFEYQNRPRRDVGWAVAYTVFAVATTVFGVYGIAHRSREFEHAFNQSYLSDPRNCPVQGRKLLEYADDDQPLDVPDFFRHAAIWLVVSSGASLVLGMLFLLIFKHAPHAMVRITIQVQIALPLALGIASLVFRQIGGGLVLLALGALAALTFYLWRNEVDLCARLLGVAAIALNSNPGLVFFVLVTKIILSLLVLPTFGLIFFSYTNGSVVVNGARGGRLECIDAQGREVLCCAWQPKPWVGFYMALASLTMLWTIFVVSQIRVFVLAGTTAQWYFAPPDAPNGTKGTTLRSVRHALGPSFGTLSFSAAVLTLVDLARNALEQARSNANSDAAAIFWSILSFFLECVYSLIEYLTKFATIMAAITGEGFLDAGRRSTDLLKRNFLKSYAVWFFPPLVLQMAAFTLSAAWGVLVFLLYWLSSKSNRPHGKSEGGILGAISFFVAWVVLSFFSSILLDIVDAVYLCYAIDKDNQTVTHADVHDIYSKVPVGAAVQQPDGELQYGAPSSRPPPAYVPPSHPNAAQHIHDSAARV